MSNSLWPQGLQPARLPHPQDSPGKDTGVGCHFLLQPANEPACQCRRHKRCGFDPWIRKNPWRREGHPTPVFLPGEPHGQRILAGYSPWVAKSHIRLKWLSTQGYLAHLSHKKPSWWLIDYIRFLYFTSSGGNEDGKSGHGRENVITKGAEAWIRMVNPGSYTNLSSKEGSNRRLGWGKSVRQSMS